MNSYFFLFLLLCFVLFSCQGQTDTKETHLIYRELKPAKGEIPERVKLEPSRFVIGIEHSGSVYYYNGSDHKPRTITFDSLPNVIEAHRHQYGKIFFSISISKKLNQISLDSLFAI